VSVFTTERSTTLRQFKKKKNCQRTTKVLNGILFIWFTFNNSSLKIIEKKC